MFSKSFGPVKQRVHDNGIQIRADIFSVPTFACLLGCLLRKYVVETDGSKILWKYLPHNLTSEQ